MKKLIIAGSSKLQERAAYWQGYFEGRGYEIIDYPAPVHGEPGSDTYTENLVDIYHSFYQNIDRADVFFLMNEDQNGFGGYVGPSAFAEISYAVIANLNHGKKIKIYLLQEPSDDQRCAEEIKFWLEQGWVKVYERPNGKKVALPVSAATSSVDEPDELPLEDENEPADTDEDSDLNETPTSSTATPTPLTHNKIKTINILTCRRRCLKPLTAVAREYLHTIAPEFPAWLLHYIAAPEFQRLAGVSMTTTDYTSIYNFTNYNSVFAHSIGVALIIWRFTMDKKQTLAGLFHDIASPAFKHAIDYYNGDAETQESIEERTAEIIRNSRAIGRQLKRDGILAGEISDYRLYPIADCEIPNLAADRLEYTYSNGYFLYNTFTLSEIKEFNENLTILKNEVGTDEIGFVSPALAKTFTKKNLDLSLKYQDDKGRASLQFIADSIRYMFDHDLLSFEDLYTMSEREIIDWILSCGDKTISEAFRSFQHATSVWSGSTAKKGCYSTNVHAKVRYITPLAATADGADRITNLSTSTKKAVEKYLNYKQSKYVGFDIEWTPEIKDKK